MLNQEDQANVKGINDQTGEVFEVVVKDIDKKKKDKGLQIEFVGGRHGERYICSSIEDFCNGRYTHLVSQPLQVVAEEIAKDNSFINNFIDISIAGNSESINIETALDITNKITKESYISDSDYKKICAKLNYEDSAEPPSSAVTACSTSSGSSRISSAAEGRDSASSASRSGRCRTMPSSEEIASASRPKRSRMRAERARPHAECTRPPYGDRMHRRQSPISSRKRSSTIVRSLGSTRVAASCSRR